VPHPNHQISNLKFPILKGVVPPHSEMLEVIERKGTSDLLRRKTGKQSPEFVLESILNLKDYRIAQKQIKTYVKMKEAGGLGLIKDDYNYKQDGLLVVVIDVTPTVEQQRAQIAGGFGTNQNFELRCQWRLRFVTF